ncbi:hypothetical protein ABPG72_017609 [Tetrahymena utriculariae]
MKQILKTILFLLLISCLTVLATNPSQSYCQIPVSKLNGQTFTSVINLDYEDRFFGDVTLSIQSDTNSILSLTLKAKNSNSKIQEYVYTPLQGQDGLVLDTNFEIIRKLTGEKQFNEIYHFIASCTEENGVLTDLQIKASFSETLKQSTSNTGFQYFQLQQQIKISSSSYQILLKFSLLILLLTI